MASIVNIKQHQEEKKANEFANNVINLIDPVDYETQVLDLVLQRTKKITYFSGDVEVGGARTFKICHSDQVLRASKSQRYSITDNHSFIRLSFDGEYLYDLYLVDWLNKPSNSALRAEILRVLFLEGDLNFKKAETAQDKFNFYMDNLLNR